MASRRCDKRSDVPVAAHAATAERLAERGNRSDQSIRVDELLADGDQIRLSAMTLNVVHTPGHARGHLVLHDAERRLLVAGDLVSALSTIVIDPPEGDLDDYLASLARVAELDATLLIPAHGSAMLEPPVRLREAIAHRHGREAKIVAALERGLQTVEELLDAAYDDTPAQVRPLAARQLQAHLDRLRATSRLSGRPADVRRSSDGVQADGRSSSGTNSSHEPWWRWMRSRASTKRNS